MDRAAPPSLAALPSRLRFLVFGVMLCVAGAHLALIHLYASDQPFSDQWGAEGHIVFVQWLHQRVESWNFLATHAEHRPILMRLLTFGLFAANGQWDCRVEMVADVLLVAGAAGVLLAFARESLRPTAQLVLAAVTTLLFSLPSNYENTLWGFQSQFYFLILLGPLHVLGTMSERRLSWRWGLAQLAGLLALFSIAAGIVSSAAVFGLAALSLLRDRRDRWAQATLAVNAGLLSFAWWLQPEAAVLNSLHAGSVGQFLGSAARMLGWPSLGWLGFLLAAPGVVFVVWSTRENRQVPPQRALVGLLVWFWLTVAVIAYGRGATGIAVRYFDVLAVGLFANLWALLLLLGSHALTRPRLRWGIIAAWLGLLLASAWSHNTPAELWSVFAAKQDFFARQSTVVTRYLASGDEADLNRDQLVRGFFPHYDMTKSVLTDPLMRRRLPPGIVPPLTVIRDDARSRDFSTNLGDTSRPATPPPAGEQIFVSQPLDRVGLPILRVPVRRLRATDGAALLLEDASGALIPPLGLPAVADEYWRTVNFRAPAGPVRLVARVPAGVPPFEFKPPVEVGWLSWFAPKIAAQWFWFLVAGVAAFVFSAWPVRGGRVVRI